MPTEGPEESRGLDHTLPVGFRDFHRRRFINYQLNRLHGLGFTRAHEIEAAAARIRTLDDYVREFEACSKLAEVEGRIEHAAFYARASETFSAHGSSAKRERYERFIDLFDRAFMSERMTRHEVGYHEELMPARHLAARPGQARGTVLFFGGFDSIVEEFFAVWLGIADAGFDVIAFDGPAQGGARLLHGLTFDHDWERRVGAVLDHFDVDHAIDWVTRWLMVAHSSDPTR
jgi:hypothetical protein